MIIEMFDVEFVYFSLSGIPSLKYSSYRRTYSQLFIFISRKPRDAIFHHCRESCSLLIACSFSCYFTSSTCGVMKIGRFQRNHLVILLAHVPPPTKTYPEFVSKVFSRFRWQINDQSEPSGNSVARALPK